MFLGSGVLDKKQAISEMRFGLSVAVILGGVISMAIMTVGTVITTEFTYEALSQALTYNIGPYAVYIFGFGMFAAGFSSAITAPLASAITARSLFDNNSNEKWKTKGRYFRMIYLGVLAVGLIFGLADVKPIPAIILAQALNGLILPFVSIFLIYVINDPLLMGENNTNRWFSNILMGIVIWVTLIIGTINIIKALGKVAGSQGLLGDHVVIIVAIISFIASTGILLAIRKFKLNRERLIVRENEFE